MKKNIIISHYQKLDFVVTYILNIKDDRKYDRKTLSVEKYLNKIRPYLKDIINNLKESDMQKVQLAMTINFISSKIMMKIIKKSA